MKRIINLFDDSHGIKISEMDLITCIQSVEFDEDLCLDYLKSFEKWYYTSEDNNGKVILNLVANSSLTKRSVKYLAEDLLETRIGLLRKIFTEAALKSSIFHSSIITEQMAYNKFIDSTGLDLKQFLSNVTKNGMLEIDSYVDWCLTHADYDEGDAETAQGRWYAEQCANYESTLDHDFNSMLDCIGHMVTEVLSLFAAVIVHNCYVLSENMFYRSVLTEIAMGLLEKLKPEMASKLTDEGVKMLKLYMRREYVAHFMAFNFIDYEQQLLHNYDYRLNIKMSDIF